MKKSLLIINLMLSISTVLFGSTGSIQGKIIDAITGEELIGATIVISGTTTGTISDFDGKYMLTNLQPGTYTINISYVSYQTLEFPDVAVTSGQVTTLNANMSEEVNELEAVQVVARSRQRTEAALQVLQKRSAIVLDGVSSDHISKLGDSDAAGALKRVTGVSVLGGKYVFVRGLSERYIRITLNDAEIPGLDPDVNTVQMDLFPANIIENIVVYKTFSPEMATFTGGQVNIVTKDFPEQATLNFSASFGYNTQSSLNKNFLSYETGKFDWLGFDDGTRDVPELVKDKEWQIYITDADTVGLYARAFNKNWNTGTKTSLLNQSYSLSYGNSYKLNGGRIGFIAALSYKKEYTYFDDGHIEQLSRNGSETANLQEKYGNEEVIWSSLAGITYKINTYNKVGINFIRNQSGASGSRYKNGVREVYPGGTQAQEISPEYVQRSITSFQVRGKHVMPSLGNIQIDWFGSTTGSVQNEPDMRFWYNTYAVSEEGDTVYNMIPNTSPLRYFRYLNENDIHSSLQVTIPLESLLEKSKIKIGGDYISKDRYSQEYRYSLKTNFGSANYNGNPDEYVSDDRLVNAENVFEGGSIYYTSALFTNDVYSYSAQDISSSGFIMLDAPVKTFMRIVGGIKYEYNNVFVENHINNDSLTWMERYNPLWNTYDFIKEKYKSGEYSTHDWLPTLNLTLFLGERTNLRLNFWKSISKPALREIAPLHFYDFLRGISFSGNSELERSINFNYDTRLEHFFNAGELISISGFYKILQNPIEVYVPDEQENIEYLYRNGKNTEVYGVETELRKTLDFIPFTSDFQIGLNLTLVYSQIDEEPDRLLEALQINPDFPTTRPMFGQAPYTLNSYLLYNNQEIGIELNIAYNISGPKLIIISQAAAPNIYEMPFNQLDFNISKKIGEHYSIKFAVKNILNEEHKTSYINKQVRDFSLAHPFDFIRPEESIADFRSYKTGTEFSVGASLNF